jgi:hypothetical protein
VLGLHAIASQAIEESATNDATICTCPWVESFIISRGSEHKKHATVTAIIARTENEHATVTAIIARTENELPHDSITEK